MLSCFMNEDSVLVFVAAALWGTAPLSLHPMSSVLGKLFSSCQAVSFCSHTGTRICFVLVQPTALKMWGEWEAVG